MGSWMKPTSLPKVLDEDELFASVCKAAGHPLDRPRVEIWRRRVARGPSLLYCRRCTPGLTCKAGHDLTDPGNVIGRTGACGPCKVVRDQALRRRRIEARDAGGSARKPGPEPGWAVSGWAPRAVLRDAACAGSDPTMFDPIEPGETTLHSEARLFRAASLCAACPVRAACAEWAQDRYLRHQEHRVAGGMYFGVRKAVRDVEGPALMSRIEVA